MTPLASILGSGLLIIVPVLERTLGALAVFGAIGVCAVAWLVGTAIRHCVRVVEPLAKSGRLDTFTRRVDQWADAIIVVAYVISVALYLRIMAQYVVAYATDGNGQLSERAIACATVVLITGIGVLRGFAGLDRLDRISLGAVLVLVTVLGGTLLLHDGRAVLGDDLHLPPVPDTGPWGVLLVLGGLLDCHVRLGSAKAQRSPLQQPFLQRKFGLTAPRPSRLDQSPPAIEVAHPDRSQPLLNGTTGVRAYPDRTDLAHLRATTQQRDLPALDDDPHPVDERSGNYAATQAGWLIAEDR